MKIRVRVRTNKVGSDSETSFKIDGDELKEIRNADEREQYISKLAQEAMFDLIEWNWEEIE